MADSVTEEPVLVNGAGEPEVNGVDHESATLDVRGKEKHEEEEEEDDTR